jgi:cytochrome c-type biogenesis protein CcmH
MKRLLLATALLCAMGLAHAIDSQPPFPDPALQTRYETLTHELRCLVCQDETVADSNAELAADFRRQIHDMVAAGKTDEEIKSYMVGRYGDFVLYKPPVQSNTALLWVGPFVLLLTALLVVSLVIRRRARQPEESGTP